jgi:hypothetical protein
MPTKLKARAMSRVAVYRIAFRLILIAAAFLFIGCAGSWEHVDPGMSLEAYKDRDVEAVVMMDGQTVEFDIGSPVGPGKGARFEGDILRGYVNGAQVEGASSQIRQIRLVQEESKTSAYVAWGVVFAVAGGLFLLFLLATPYQGME